MRGCWRAPGPRLVGLAALVWFLVRVVPRPSRAAYPCQRAAFPLASAFVLWLIALVPAGVLLARVRRSWRQRRWVAAGVLLGLAAACGMGAWFLQPGTPARASAQVTNDPLGLARGLQAGRVTWSHDPAATDWAGPGDGHWWEPAHTDQAVVSAMLSRTLRGLSGAADDAAAWDGLIRHFNLARGRGDVGYTPGEKIVVKINLVGCHAEPGWGGVDPVTYDLVLRRDYMNASPQVVLALLRQLVGVVGVAQADIAVGDPLALFPDEFHRMLAAEFPDVAYLDHAGGTVDSPRTAVGFSTVPLHWSCHPAGVAQDFLPTSYVEATYQINLANFKSHQGAGITLGAKNHYGSLIRVPVADGYYDMHESLAYREPAAGSYRAVVDLLGHAHTGGKTFLYLVDGLYAGVHPDDGAPHRWTAAPFGDDWTSSLFASQDPVALESVCFDLMQLEGDPRGYPLMAGVDDYLHEAALADAPPSGTFYDPDHAGDVTRLSSLGVHEHWDGPVTMAYSRNLGTGEGIELVRLGAVSAVPAVASPPVVHNVPNPFNPRTVIRYALPATGHVRLRVYDARGRLVRTLVDATVEQGNREAVWEGRDTRGREVASGVYFHTLETTGSVTTGKMTLLR